MVKGFWAKLKKPIFVLAPMANVTDAAFRRVIAKYGKPDVLWTEFVAADALLSEGRSRILPDLWFDESERPIVAQIFGSSPENIKKAASLIAELGFDGLDLNMGCPDKNVEKQGAGAALLKDFKKAKEIIAAAQEGAPNLPISVKTRLGYSENILIPWLENLLEADLAAIIVHARTRNEMSLVPARWNDLVEGAKVVKASGKETLILGNGDVQTLAEARERVKEIGVDGVMIGRGIFGNPWLFSEHQPSLEEKMQVTLEHTDLFEKLFTDIKGFEVMRKHYKAYVAGFDGAKELRGQLMNAENAAEVRQIVQDYFPEFKL